MAARADAEVQDTALGLLGTLAEFHRAGPLIVVRVAEQHHVDLARHEYRLEVGPAGGKHWIGQQLSFGSRRSRRG